ASSGRGGRWTVFPGRATPASAEERLQRWAWQLLRRYGVLFRDLMTREAAAPSWWELVPALRRLEARGEIRGGRFVSQVAGEQYALPEAIEELRRPRDGEDRWLVVSAADPLNLEGILDGRPRAPALRGNRLLYRNGRVAAVLQAGNLSWREELPEPLKAKAARALQLQVPFLRETVLAELHAAAAESRSW
ncbi:MAG: DEAD/DEAH box helicase, partial [Elusimicrobia bacterium]|nr:DEAD/DEAH box helicase [Elusimicrobiota bacterium]